MVITFLLKLILIESGQLLNALIALDIVLLHLYSHLAFFASQSVQVVFVLLACLFQSTSNFVNLVLSFLKFIAQSFQLSLMQIFEFFFILSMSSDKVVLCVFVLSLDHIEFVILLILHLFDFVFQERNLL